MTAARKSYDNTDLARAEFLYECAVEAAKRSSVEGLLAEAEYRLGSAYLQSHKYLKAEEALLNGLESSKRSNSEIWLIDNLCTLCVLYIRLSKYDSANEVSGQALERIKKSTTRTTVPYRYGEAVVCSNLGTIAAWKGETASALQYLSQAVDLFEQLDREIGGYGSSALDNLMVMGEVHYDSGEYRLALDCYSKVLQAAELHETTKLLQSVLNDLGILYMDQVDFVKANEYFARSLAAAKEIKDQEAATIATCNLGVTNERQGMYQRAGEAFSDCLKLANQGARLDLTLPALEGLGTIYRRTGQNKQALGYYDRALQAAIKMGDRLRQSELLWRKAGVYYDLREYKTSIELSEQARSLADEIHEPNYSYLALTLIGKNDLALGQAESARSALTLAIGKAEEIRSRVGGQELQRAYFFERKIEPYYLMVDLLIRQNRPEEALEFAERAKSRTLLDLIGNARLDIAGAMSSEEKTQERTLEGQLAALNTQLNREYQQRSSDPIRVNAVQTQLSKARFDYDTFLDRLYASHPALRADRAQTVPFSLQDAKIVLGSEDAAVVEFQVLDDKVHVFTIAFAGGAPRITTYSIAINHRTLSDEVEQLRGRIAGNSLGVDKLSTELFQLLLGPAARILEGKKTIVVVPDDVLWGLPFQALKDSSGHYLVENHPLFYAPSLTVLREMMRRESAVSTGNASKETPERNANSEPSLFAVGDPTISRGATDGLKAAPKGARLGPIPETRTEVALLGSLYGHSRSELLVGDQATEDKAKADMSHFKVLHFATHGILDEQDPLYSYIVLSRAAGSTEDGLLEAREIMAMSLTADIAILSACETARGRISTGEGVIGMAWALFVAGCSTTVASQWSVESESTTKLMIEFHRALLADNRQSGRIGKAAEALREAQLKLLKTQTYSHPFYWAGFIVVGDGW